MSRGRDSGCPLPPAQTRARATNAHGSHLGDKHAQALWDCTCSRRHCIAPVFSGTVSSSGPCLGISLADRLPSTCSACGPPPLFADFVGTMRPLDSPLPCMRDLWLIAFSPRPANCPRAATGSPGSRAWSFSACLGSLTPRGRAALALSCTALWPSMLSDAVGSPKHAISELNTQPTDTPVQTLQRRRYCRPRMARCRGGSLYLPRTTLAFATPCRFIPALSRLRVRATKFQP